MISWTSVKSLTTSNKPGTKWWLLTHTRQMWAASRTQASLWSPFLLVGPTLSCTMGSLITWLPHSSLWQTQLSVRPNHAKNTFPWTVFKGATWMSKRGTKITDFVAAGLKVPPITPRLIRSGDTSVASVSTCYKELRDPDRNFCKCMVNSPHKFNCDPKTNMIHNVPEDNKKSWVYDKQVVYSHNIHT